MRWAQLQGLLWLRWRLTRNQWRRSGQINAVLTLVLLVIALCLAVVGGIAGVAGGAFGLAHAAPRVSLVVWDLLVVVFLAFWTVGVVAELQRSEMLDVSRLLFLPVSLRDVFFLNYLSSHFSLSLAMILPAMLGLAVGLMFGAGLAMVLLFPLIFGFFFMITAWTYCLRGWLASLMVNKRRRRAIVLGVTMMLVLLSQLPNLLTNVWFNHRLATRPPAGEQLVEWRKQQAEDDERKFAMIKEAHQYVPLFWLPNGAKGLMEGRAWPAVWGAFGMFAIGAWGLAHAYRSTLRFYLGGKIKKLAPTPSAVRSTHAGRRILVERRVPAVPEAAGAMAMASIRSMLRAPEVKMSLGANVLVFLFLGASMFLRRTAPLSATVEPFVVGAVVTVTLFGLTQLMFNHFGFDRSGFRAIVLLPTPRRHILLGKNLALLPVALMVFVIYLGLAVVLAHLEAWNIVAGVAEFVAAFLVMSVVGNVASILVPFRIAAGSLKATKTDMTTKALLFVVHLLFPMAMAPVFLPAALGALCGRFDWLPAGPVSLACAVLLAILSGVLYWQTLEPLGRLLQRREQTILQVVTQEVE
jgi:hypothetical protein